MPPTQKGLLDLSKTNATTLLNSLTDGLQPDILKILDSPFGGFMKWRPSPRPKPGNK